MKHLIFVVTNDLNYDQRMIRICTSLADKGNQVLLVGRRTNRSISILPQPFKQKRLPVWFTKSKWFYIEYNFRLLFYLLFKKADLICAVDLDSILPVYIISRLKGIVRVHDAHELFCEMKEVVSRPRIYRFWKKVEQFALPKFINGYTVSKPIANEFHKMYGLNYEVIQNTPVLLPGEIPARNHKYLLYQGAINEGRSFETLIPAMKQVNIPLIICGDGNFMKQAIALVEEHGLQKKIIFRGKIPPTELREITLKAFIGITLFEKSGLSNYYSAANRFFDYMHAGLPQLCVNYPVYNEINDQFKVALLIEDLGPDSIARELNRLIADESLYRELQLNCLLAREEFNWQKEEKKLLAFYQAHLPLG
ncbi:MAG TPA: glycosyltransferase family 4 protein [Chitinophagaceae bacterium]|nr:glycosyltransferase family 4 protein [Chitinophagaceae bacterium]